MNTVLSKRRSLTLLTFSLALAACSVPSADDLEVSSKVTDASLNITKGPLESQANGSFLLTLSLGPNASSASDVTVKQFALLRSSDNASLAPLPYIGVSAKRVEVSTTEKIAYLVDTPLPAKDAMEICNAGPVKIIATLHDGARNRITTAESESFTVICK